MIPMSAWFAARAAAHAEGSVYSMAKSRAASPCSKSHMRGAVFRKEIAEMRSGAINNRV
jgi:hypothetical protein